MMYWVNFFLVFFVSKNEEKARKEKTLFLTTPGNLRELVNTVTIDIENYDL